MKIKINTQEFVDLLIDFCSKSIDDTVCKSDDEALKKAQKNPRAHVLDDVSRKHLREAEENEKKEVGLLILKWDNFQKEVKYVQ